MSVSRLEKLKHYLSIDPENTSLMRDIAQTCLQEGETDQALEYYQRLMEQNAVDAIELNNVAVSLLEKGDFSAALKFCSYAEKLDPGKTEILLNLAYSQLALNQPQQAGQTLDEIFREHPDEPQALYYQGLCLDMQGDNQGAVDKYQKVTQIKKDHRLAQFMLANNDLSKGDLLSAQKRVKGLLEKDPRNVDALYLKAILYLTDLQPELAAKTLNTAIAIRSDVSELHSALGQALTMLFRLRQAREAFSRACQLDPQSQTAFAGKAWVELLVDDLTAANESINSLLHLDANHAEGHAMKAMLALSENNLQVAQHHVKLAESLEADNLMVQLVKTAMDQITGAGQESALKLRSLIENQTIQEGDHQTLLLQRLQASPLMHKVERKMTRFIKHRVSQLDLENEAENATKH